MADGARNVLIQPRKLVVDTTLGAKLASLDTDDITALRITDGELVTSPLGHGFVVSTAATKIWDGTTNANTNLIPLVTPTDVLAKFTSAFNITDITEVEASKILFHTTDVNSTVDVTKHKQMSLADIKSWIAAANNTADIGKIKFNDTDTKGYFQDKVLGTVKTVSNPVAVTLTKDETIVGDWKYKVSATVAFDTDQVKIDTANQRYQISVINGGTI